MHLDSRKSFSSLVLLVTFVAGSFNSRVNFLAFLALFGIFFHRSGEWRKRVVRTPFRVAVSSPISQFSIEGIRSVDRNSLRVFIMRLIIPFNRRRFSETVLVIDPRLILLLSLSLHVPVLLGFLLER